MLTLGAMMLLAFLVLRVNSTSITTSEMVTNSKMGILAISVANSYIDVAKKKAFDEAVMDTTKTDVLLSDLTLPCGKEVGEVYPNFDDFDDYNLKGVVLVDTTTLVNPTHSTQATPFFITSDVFYISDTNPDSAAVGRTWNKKLVVKVWTHGMNDTIVMSTISSLW